MRRNIVQLLALAIIPFVCTACQIMPVEEELPSAPVIRAYEAEEYEQTPVMRGDLILSKTVKCTYVSAKQESLSFSLGGMFIDKVYVSVGQQVRAGELMAELEQGDLLEQISNQEYVIEVLQANKSNILENQELEAQRQDAVIAGMEEQLASLIEQMKDCDEQTKETLTQQASAVVVKKQAQEEAKEAANEAYEDQLLEVEDSLYIEGLRLEELQETLRERQIYAGIDGTVTYLLKIKEDDRSVKGKTVFTISDLDTTVFTVEGENAQYFPVGTEVTLVCNKKEYMACAVDASEFGITKQQEDDSPVAYLQLVQPDPTLEDGDKGSIQLILDQRKDVLYVARDAIRSADGEQFVYMLDEDGLRIMQKVTTGLEAGEYIEITGGLAEGDSVIIE